MKEATRAKIEESIERCREAGLRRTKALEAVLLELIESTRPKTLADLVEAPGIGDQCDKATVYRLLVRLEEKGVVRRLGLHARSAYYAMLYPGEHHDYLICTECGSIDQLCIPCPVEALEKTISKKFGFTRLYHELEFFGVCSECG